MIPDMLTKSRCMNDATTRNKQRINHIRIILHQKLEKFNNRINAKIIFLIICFYMMFLPNFKSFDLFTKTRDFTSQMWEKHMFAWDCKTIYIYVRGTTRHAISVRTHNR